MGCGGHGWPGGIGPSPSSVRGSDFRGAAAAGAAMASTTLRDTQPEGCLMRNRSTPREFVEASSTLISVPTARGSPTTSLSSSTPFLTIAPFLARTR